MIPVDARANAIAGPQHGLARPGQLRDAGIDRRTIARRLETGVWRWRDGFQDILELPGHTETWQRAVMALILAAGDSRGRGAVASHRTAGHLWGLLDVRRPGRVDVLANRPTRDPDLPIHTTIHLPPEDVSEVDGIPVTSVGRTVVDLAGCLPHWHLELLIIDTIRRRRTSADEVRRLAEERARLRGVVQLRQILDALPEEVSKLESPLEVRGIPFFRRGRLPAPRIQYVVMSEDGEFLKRADFAWPEHRVIVEMDSRLWHSGDTRRRIDDEQRDRLRVEGWIVIEVRIEDLRAPERRASKLAEIRAALSM